MDGPNVTLTVIDSKPTPFAKGFAVSLEFLTMFDQATIVAYFDDIEVAAQLEGVPRSVEITAPLGA
jgi:hypothetical protein